VVSAADPVRSKTITNKNKTKALNPSFLSHNLGELTLLLDKKKSKSNYDCHIHTETKMTMAR
jgi:hypothetical protein